MKAETNLLPCGTCTMCCRGEAIFLYPEDGDNPGLYRTRQIWHPVENRPAHILEKRNGAWQVVFSQATRVPEKK